MPNRSWTFFNGIGKKALSTVYICKFTPCANHPLFTPQLGPPVLAPAAVGLNFGFQLFDPKAQVPEKPFARQFRIVITCRVQAANERRETANCTTPLKDQKVAVVILGRNHDLSDNVPADCQYVRVAVKGEVDPRSWTGGGAAEEWRWERQRTFD